MTSYIPTFLTCRLDSFNPVQLRTNMESLGPGMYLVTYKDVFVTYRWFPGGMVAVRPYRFFYSHSSQPSSSSTRHMRTHGLRSSVLAGVHWHIVSLCSLGSSLFLSNAWQNNLPRIPDLRQISSYRLCSFLVVPLQSLI